MNKMFMEYSLLFEFRSPIDMYTSDLYYLIKKFFQISFRYNFDYFLKSKIGLDDRDIKFFTYHNQLFSLKFDEHDYGQCNNIPGKRNNAFLQINIPQNVQDDSADNAFCLLNQRLLGGNQECLSF